MIQKQILLALISKYAHQNPLETSAKDCVALVESTDDYWKVSQLSGHVTASAWVVNHNRDKVLLCRHKKIDKWLPLGGHIELEDDSIFETAQRELIEESGNDDFKLLSDDIFDIDVHVIPAYQETPEHKHYDIRILFEGNSDEFVPPLHPDTAPVAWVNMNQIEDFVTDPSIIRLMEKTKLKYPQVNF